MVLNTSVIFDAPGVYVTEDTYGATPASLASFNAVYMLFYTNKAGISYVPRAVTSLDDFTNVYGASLSTNSVRLFFEQRGGVALTCVPVEPKASYTVAIPTATVGATYTLTIDGFAVSVLAVTGDTVASLLDKLEVQVNTIATHLAYYTPSDILRVSTGTTVTASANITLGSVSTAAAYPVVGDVVNTLNRAFDPILKAGYLITPEFFQSFTVANDRTALAMAMEAHCANPRYNWAAIADCGATTATTLTGAGAVNLARAEKLALSSPKGHLSYFFPYWKNYNGVLVPMSASVAGIAMRLYRELGYHQPPAGARVPVYGVVDTSYPITTEIQELLNPLNINCGRRFNNGNGTLVYGSRTVSTSNYYKFIATRIILNVLDNTLARAFDDFVFSSVDGQGVQFSRIKQTCIDVCEQMRSAGALYGVTPEDAYLIICDERNNSALNLENGLVTVDVIVKPSSILEKLHIRVNRASLGTVLSEVVSSGDVSPIADVAQQAGQSQQ